MQGQMQHQPDAALAGVIGSCRAELSELYGVVQQEQKRKLQRWQDEEPMLECQIEALTGTRDIIQREQKQLTTELADLKALLEKQAAEAGQQAGPNTAFDAANEALLQEQLQELSSKIAQLDGELTDLVPKLSGAGGAGCKPDELSYYETKLVVIQDTRRLLQAEATALSAEIKRRQTAARLAADRDTAAQLGLSDLGRLGERLAGVEAALDRAKVERYFPAQRGFRFSGGGGGVYCGVKDLHLSEVSGAFNISLEAVPAAGAGAGAAGAGAAAQREVRLKVTLSGIASGASSQEYKQQQQQQKQQQAAKAAAQAKSLKRQQTYQQQQQQQQQGSPLRRAQSRLAPDSPSRQQQQGRPAAGPGGGSSSGGFSSSGAGSAGGSKRNAAIAKFLGQLNDKKDALSNAIKTSPLSKGLESSSSPRAGGQPRALNFSTGSPGSGFTRHLAGTFGDKAAGFSQRLGQQNAAAGSSSSAGLLGGLAGTGLQGSSSGDLLGSSAYGSTDGSNAAAAAAAASSIDGSSGSMLAAADHPAAAGQSHGLSGLSTAASTESSSDFAAAKQPPPDSPTAMSNLQGPRASIDSRGSGSWPTPESPQDKQLKAKLGSMKGRFGGLLAESKQKLADSKLMQESKQKLAQSKQKLADSKFISESRAAAKHLLEDSKHLFEDSKAGLKKGLSNLQDKPSHGHPSLQQQQHPSSQGSTPQQGSTPRSSIDRQQQQQQHQQVTRQQHVQPPLQTGVLGSPSAAPAQPPDTPPESADSAAASADLAALPAPAAASNQCSSAPDGAGPPNSGPEQKIEDAAAVAAADANDAATAGGSSTACAFPAVTAATASAASTGEQERHLLDEAWVWDEQGGMHAGSGGGSSIGWLPGSGAAAAAGVAGGKGSGSRKGVVVMLLAEGLEILGEKGTKVPNIRAAQLGLEVECVLSACLTYSSTLGWQSAGLSFEVVSLERVVEGSNIPVPKTLIKSVLNLVMPSVFTKLLLTSLPHELGQFILDSAATAAASSSATTAAGSNTKPAAGGGAVAPTRATAAAVAAAGGAGVWLSGELCLAGPPLACLSACLTRSAEEVPAGRVSLTNFVQELRAAQKARALLSLPDPRHTRALALLFTPGSPYCLLNHPAAAAAAAAGGSAAVSSGSTVLGLPASLTLRELCRFYLDHSDSSAWPEICAMWQLAVDAVCLHLAREDGLLPPAADSAAAANTAGSDAVAITPTAASDSTGAAAGTQQPQQQQQERFTFSFEQLLNGRVAALVRKPVRLSFGLNKLLLGLDAAAGLAAARDYCERAAREFAESAKGEDALLLLQRPLSQQLELLHLWHAAMSTYLATFLQQFKETGGRVMLAADKGSFSIAVEELTYEGPMRLQIPLPLLADLATGACTFDLQLPNPEVAVSSLTNKLRFVSSALSKAAFGKCEQECAASRHAAAVEAAIKSGTDLPLTLLEELEALMTIWNAGTHEQKQQQQLHPTAGTHTAAAGSSSGSGIKLSRATSSNQRSSSTAAAAATASITRNSLTNAARTSSINAGSDSAPGSSPGAVPDTAAAASTAAVSNGNLVGRDSVTPAATVGGKAGNCSSAAGGGGGCGDAGSSAAGGGGGMIGRVCMTKASAGLVLDEKRLKELMAGGGLQDAGLLGGVLACFGQLFTATIAPGWPSRQDGSLLAASMEMGNNSSSGSSSGNDVTATDNAAAAAAAPQTIVTVRNNEVTRVKAALEAASFESAVSPRIAVRLLHMLVLATAHKFGSGSSKRLEVIHKVFTHVAEYLGRDCLDLLVCVDVAAAAVEPTPAAAAAAGGGAQGSTLLQQQQQGPALQLLLAGAAPGTGPGAGVGPTGGSSGSSSSTGGACCYIINDVNLLTVLETVRLLMEYSS